MQAGHLSTFLKSGAIWAFVVLELIFFSVAGEFLSLSDKAFMDIDNMLLLLKQSAPIGIIAMGMTIIMINGKLRKCSIDKHRHEVAEQKKAGQ